MISGLYAHLCPHCSGESLPMSFGLHIRGLLSFLMWVVTFINRICIDTPAGKCAVVYDFIRSWGMVFKTAYSILPSHPPSPLNAFPYQNLSPIPLLFSDSLLR